MRARCRGDLEGLKTACGLEEEIHQSVPADYRWRIILRDPAVLQRVFERLAETLDYDNFKGMIGETEGQKAKLGIYHGWWDDMHSFQERME